MDKRIKQVYKLPDGRIFENYDDAMTELKNDDMLKYINESDDDKLIEIKNKLIEYYKLNNIDLQKCNCLNSKSDKCLLHYCTCPLKCNRHTNLYFKNKGCYWCNYTDCSKYGC